MTNLQKLALNATAKNITTKKAKKSINDHLFQMLYTESRKMQRAEIIAEISLKRLEESIGNEIDEQMLKDAIADGSFAKINKTAKNGLDTAVCSGKTTASFCSNKRYEDYELNQDADGFYIIKK